MARVGMPPAAHNVRGVSHSLNQPQSLGAIESKRPESLRDDAHDLSDGRVMWSLRDDARDLPDGRGMRSENAHQHVAHPHADRGIQVSPTAVLQHVVKKMWPGRREVNPDIAPSREYHVARRPGGREVNPKPTQIFDRRATMMTLPDEQVDPNLPNPSIRPTLLQRVHRTPSKGPAFAKQTKPLDDKISSTWKGPTPAHAVSILGFCTNSECSGECEVPLCAGTTNIGAEMDKWQCRRCNCSFHPRQVISSPESEWRLEVTFKEQGKNKSSKDILTPERAVLSPQGRLQVRLAPEGAVLSHASITVSQ